MTHRHPPGFRPKAPAARLPDRETLAAQVLGFLAEDGERLARFMALTGVTPTSIRRAAATTGFADAVMSYLVSDESLLVAFAAGHRYDPEAVGRTALPPDGEPPW